MYQIKQMNLNYNKNKYLSTEGYAELAFSIITIIKRVVYQIYKIFKSKLYH